MIPSHLLDHKLFDFKSINRDSGIIDGGDKAFDPPELPRRRCWTSTRWTCWTSLRCAKPTSTIKRSAWRSFSFYAGHPR
ncbi:hypothetical protein H2136_19945 [Aeromonas hydrophila]|uniref:Uncharacterized protein n=1 Tax=Aeromonas hydrophila TaxID=644 RepID=A0A926FMA7_AERHY|nr:hypothetical protein [Aeromonas hydrophila]